jgi:hypothetical protein
MGYNVTQANDAYTAFYNHARLPQGSLPTCFCWQSVLGLFYRLYKLPAREQDIGALTFLIFPTRFNEILY